MRCPQCGSTTQVYDSRPTVDGSVHRRRRCENEHRFSTREVMIDAGDARSNMTSLLKSLDDVGTGMQRLSAAQMEHTAVAAKLARRMKALEAELVDLLNHQRDGAVMGTEVAD